MEKFLEKVVLGADEQRQGQAGIPTSTGSGNSSSGGGGGGGFSHQDDVDLRGAAEQAAHSTNDSSDFFSGILNQLGPNKAQVAEQGIDEEAAIRHHKAFYNPSPSPQSTTTSPSSSSPSSSSATSQGMGSAAAMQALKLFTSGSATQSTSQSAFIALAMSQAAKLFDQQASAGNLASEASKESAVMKAGELALQMFLRSQRDSGAAGNKFPGAGAGPAGLLDLAGRLMA